MKDEIQEKIDSLPKGYISNKAINGRIRHYLQWVEGGKIQSRYIPDEDYEKTKAGIEERKSLQKKLRALKREKPKHPLSDFETNVILGNDLRRLVSSVAKFQKRDCYRILSEYLRKDSDSRICSVYGLRRTGKTTMLFQAIADMDEESISKSVYIKARKGETMAMLGRDLKKLSENGYKFVFIDEITFLDDFIDTASFLSDIYAAMGMKIIISGTDSLGIYLASKNELYDRTYFVHTTWIPFREHSRLLGTDDVDKYIRYGGTLRPGESDFEDEELIDESVSFRDDESTRRYIDTSICSNIQHSLKCFEDGSHFRKLRELYEAGELTNAINRVIEGMNHRFVLRVLTDNFKSHDLGVAKKNLLKEKDPTLRSDALEKVDGKAVVHRLMAILEIKNKESLRIPLEEEHVREIKEYLAALELIEKCPVQYLGSKREEADENVLFTQPGMRYCQAEALVYSLKKDELFSMLGEREKDYVCSKILDEVKGRMLEEIVLYETMRKLKKNHKVFKLEFLEGEFDMVIMDKKTYGCKLYEIKHSDVVDPNQYRHLVNDDYCKGVEWSFGAIKGKYVLYRGEGKTLSNGVRYLNVVEYLKSL